MPNQLANETSPYLLQHANNPVDWYPWGIEALEKALKEDKPIFLSVGYASCHWCHVMAHESFEDPEIAAIMNSSFISIKVDREERPDLDVIYMKAVVAMTGQGGWPMSFFIMPDGKPFYGGTYFPPVRRFNLPSFREVLLTIARLWHEDRRRLLESGNQISEFLQKKSESNPSATPLSEKKLDQATLNIVQAYDWKNGGWGKAPKFPQPMTIEYLLRRSTGDGKATGSDQMVIKMAVHALRAMAKGGMYDVVGGGFARYSTDDQWCIPHFEKMLYDNAQLALVYLHGWLITGEALFRRICEETLDFILREMTHPLGGFYSSLDADSEGEEGKYYIWTLDEIQAILNDPQDNALFTAAYNITATGNFEGKIVLHRALNDEQLSTLFNLPVGTIPDRLSELHNKLLPVRARRVRPNSDDKILVAWNALAMAAFAEAGRYLGRKDYLAAAQRNARFLLENLIHDGRLLRAWRAGQAKHNAYLEDYAALILGLLALYQSDTRIEWYAVAIKLANEMIYHYADAEGGFFDTRDDHEALLLRPKDVQDNATPSGNSLGACALLQLAAYEGRSEWHDLVEGMLSMIQEAMAGYPTAFSQWLCAVDFARGPINEVAVIGDASHTQTQALVQTLWKKYRPRQVAAISAFPPEPGSPALLIDRPMTNGLPTAYVCQGFVCFRPTNSADEMAAQLG